jgi:hypothetical protein
MPVMHSLARYESRESAFQDVCLLAAQIIFAATFSSMLY